MSDCDAWRDLARGRLELIEQLKVEKRKLQSELDFLETVLPLPITRVHVITDEPREYWADSWTSHIQDDGRTVKLIAVGDGAAAKHERDLALGKQLAARIYCVRCGGGFPGPHDCGRNASP